MKKITPFKLKSRSELDLRCGKSTVDGTYVRGVYKKMDGINYIDNIPVHLWSVGIILEKFDEPVAASSPPSKEVDRVWVEVPCSERLPATDKEVAVIAKAWNRSPMENAMFTHGDKKFTCTYSNDSGEQVEDITQYVTAWLELRSLPLHEINNDKK